MPLIGYPIGDIDEHIIIDDIYAPKDFKAGWYFIPYNFPNYEFMSVDIDPNIDEVVEDGDKFYIYGFDPYLEKMSFPEGEEPRKEYFSSKSIYPHYPSGVPYNLDLNYFWEMFGDLNNPYLFIPYFKPDTYGRIVWLDFNTPIPIINTNFTIVEKVLNGLIFKVFEKVVADKTDSLKLKEKIVSLLSCDIEMISPKKMRLTWKGEKVPYVEILRKEISDNDFKEPIAVIPFEVGEYIFELDDNSYIYSIRGSNETGKSDVEVTLGVRGLTTIKATINLGDFVKIYEGDMQFVDVFETEILI